MSGHNRWSKLKRRKAVLGVSKGRVYSKILKELAMAARLGGGDPAGNARLRVAVAAARENNVPGESVTRAIKRGTGELEGAAYEEVLYEGYGPGGVAVLVECLTDNRNRSAADVRQIFGRGGGSFAAEGAVAWGFHRKGAIEVKPGPTEDAVLEKALDAGAEDVVPFEGGAEGFEVRTEPNALHAVAAALEKSGLALGEQKWTYLPTTTVKLEGENLQKMEKLLELLDENDDVQNVFANLE